MTSSHPPEIQRLLDHEAIRACIVRYTRGLDRHDEDMIASAFHPDAVISYGEHFVGPLDEFRKWANQVHDRSWAGHQHHITSQTIDIAGDTAHVESYLLHFLRRKDGKSVDLGGARYIDKLERRDGDWRITVREYVVDVFMVLDGTPYEELARVYPVGTWDRTDLSYARPLKPREKMGGQRDAQPAFAKTGG